MAVPRSTVWPIPAHTKVKHIILKRYLEAWLPIMSKHNGRIVFIDGFAGPGVYSGGEDGSPVIALRTLLDHPHFQKADRGVEVVFFFIESEPDRAASLREVLAALGAKKPIPKWARVEVVEGEFASNLSRMLDVVETQGTGIAPTFAFIDPFGFSGLPMFVIARLVRNRSCECLINFSFDSINRFVEHPNPEIQHHFDELFGTTDWRGLLNEGGTESRRDKIVDLYRRQLMNVTKLKYVRTFEMVNEGNRTEYVLVFGTNSPDGLSKMKQAMWKADPEGGHVFSDRSDPRQMVLLQAGGEAGLRAALRSEFTGKGFIPIGVVEQFVLEDTAYSEKMHLKKKTLSPMERATPPQIEVRRAGGVRNRAGDYPVGTRVKFL